MIILVQLIHELLQILFLIKFFHKFDSSI